MIHIIVLLSICCLGVFFYRNGSSYQKNKKFVISSFLILFFVEALRGSNVGWDTQTYINHFNSINAYVHGMSSYSSAYEKWEKLWVALNALVGIVLKDSQWLLAAASMIILVGFGYFILHNVNENESAFWPVFFFMALGQYFSTMNLLRQYCAMAIAINIYTVLQNGISKKNIVKSLILLAVAFGFHTTGILYAAIILVFIIPITRKTITAILCVAGICYVGFSNILRYFADIFPKYARYVVIFFNGEKYTGATLGGYTQILTLLKIIVVCATFLLNPQYKENKALYKLSFFAIISVGGALMTTQISLAGRVNYYFEIFLILLIPKLINRMKSRRTMLYSIVFLLGWMTFLFLIYGNNGNMTKGCMPYSFFWQ